MRTAEEWERMVGPKRWAEMNDPAHPCRDCGALGFRVFAQHKDTGLDACVNHEERAVLDGLATQRATLDDGTVDPFVFAGELADLLPAVPGMPSNSDPWPGRDNA